jgi:DNA-binding NarL/FixJ family response regulator
MFFRMTIRILLADDHRMVRDALRSLLRTEPGMEVVAEAHDGASAVRLAEQRTPDVVVMDISMPDLDGIAATRQIRSANPEVKVVALTAHANPRVASQMLAAGALGYLPKDVAADELATAIRTVMDDKVYLSPPIARALSAELGGPAPQWGTPVAPITPREREVLQLTAQGLAMKEIAAALNISIKTVETHRRQVMDKLGMYSVAELTRHALREGLTSIDPGPGVRASD